MSEVHLVVAAAFAALSAGSGYIAVEALSGHPRWGGSIIGGWAIFQAPAALVAAVYFLQRAFQ